MTVSGFFVWSRIFNFDGSAFSNQSEHSLVLLSEIFRHSNVSITRKYLVETGRDWERISVTLKIKPDSL